MAFSFKLLAAAAAAAVLLAGCSSVSLDESAKEGTLAAEQTQQQADPFSDPSSPLSRRSVYFAFDSYDVQPEYAAIVEAHAKWLLDHPDVKITIQGNTDERGGREYNIALGQKRSEAVKQRMQLLGVAPSRIESVSFGKEKPVALGHTEEAWAQNRRADIVYPMKPAAESAPAQETGAQQ